MSEDNTAQTPAEDALANADADNFMPDEGNETSREVTPESKDAPTEETPAEPEAKETEAKEDTEEPAPKEEPQDGEPESQETEKEIARRAFQERQRTRQQISQQLDKVYGPKTEQDLQDEGLTPEQAQIEALRQEMLYKDQRNQIADLNAGLQAEAENVMQDFSIFNPSSPDFDKDYAAEVEARYQRAARFQTDEQGIVINADESLYDFYEFAAKAYGRGTSKGTDTGQKNALKMLSRAESPSSSSNAESTEEDPLLKGFDNVK